MNITFDKRRWITVIILWFAVMCFITSTDSLWRYKVDVGQQMVFTENTYGIVATNGTVIQQSFRAEQQYLGAISVLAVKGENESALNKPNMILTDQDGKKIAEHQMEIDSVSGMLRVELNIKLQYGDKYNIIISFDGVQDMYSVYFVPGSDLQENMDCSVINEEIVDSVLFVWYDYEKFRTTLFLLFFIPFLLIEILILIKPVNAIISFMFDSVGVLCSIVLCVNAVNCLSGSLVENMLGRAWVITIVFILILIGLFTIATRRLNLGVMIPISIFFAYGIIIHYVMLFRGTPFLPIDILALKTAKDVALNYTYSIDNTIIQAITSYLLVLVFWIFKKRRISVDTGKCLYVAIILVIALTTIGTPRFTQAVNMSPYYYSQEHGNELYGAIFNFVTNIQACFHQKPKGYSIERVEKIAEHYSGLDQIYKNNGGGYCLI